MPLMFGSKAINWQYCWRNGGHFASVSMCKTGKYATYVKTPIISPYDILWEEITYLQGLYLLNGRTSYRRTSWRLKAAKFGFKLFQSLWNSTGTLSTELRRCLSNFRAIRSLQHPISRLQVFTRLGGKTSCIQCTVKPVCNDHLSNKIYYLWFIQ